MNSRHVASAGQARAVFMFSGQGSQYYRMGLRLYESEPRFRELLDELDTCVQAELGESVLQQVFRADRRSDEVFDDLRYTQPAIFMVEYALARLLEGEGIEPAFVLGVSLGELAAAAVSGALEARDCLRLLVRQVGAFEAHCPRGGMLAVLADPELYETHALLRAECELAGVQSHANFVLAGREAGLARVEQYLTRERILWQRLPVRYPFHTSLIEPLAGPVKALLRDLPARPARLPFISCTSGLRSAGFQAEDFWEVLRRPFRPGQVFDELEAKGPFVYLDLGPSGTLWTLAKARLRASGGSRTFPLMSPFAQETKLLADVRAHFQRARPASVRTEPPSMTTKRLKVYAFPGQGSQFKGMGRELFERFPELLARADDVLGYSLRRLCVEDPDGLLGRTEYTQPALYVVNALAYLKTLQDGGALPDYVLGHSLGEYDALFAASAFDFETGLRLVKQRGELMSRVSGGSMAAVVGCTAETVAAILAENGLADLDVANFNAPTQAVLAGPRASLQSAAALFERAGARYVPLNVSAPFHSRYMQAAATAFGQHLRGFELARPKLPVIANVDARPYDDDVSARLEQQILRPVLWTDSIRYLMGLGLPEVTELGPGRVLTGLVTKILKEATPLVVAAPVAADTPPVALRAGPARGTAELSARNGQGPGSVPAPTPRDTGAFEARALGSRRFREDYGVRYAYVAGGMHRGISSRALVTRMARAGFMAYYGTHGLPLEQIERELLGLRDELRGGEPFGANLTYDPFRPLLETQLVELFLRTDCRCLEVSAYPEITPALVKYRLRGAAAGPDGRVLAARRVLAKVARPEAALLFLAPAPERIVRRLCEQGDLAEQEAALAPRLPMADDLCAQADAGGHTELGALPALVPAIIDLRDRAGREFAPAGAVRVGASGGIGTAAAAAAAFMLGADFVLTGSINQCTVEAQTSTRAKDMLQQLDVQDSTYAPSGDMFELGARVRVMKRGVFFHARAARLHDLWRNYARWEDVAADTRRQIEERYLRTSFDQAYLQARGLLGAGPAGAEQDPKQRMALVFRWYCERATQFALEGAEHEVDYQVYCGPALGAFNRWVNGTALENWRDRHVDELGTKIMEGAAALFNDTWNTRGATDRR